jgi:hypothetical protein
MIGGLVVAAGCSPAKPQYPVQGVVSLDGQPMASGEIYFKVPTVGFIKPLVVRSGSFQGAVEVPGKHRVEIYSFRKPSLSAEELAKLDPVGRDMAQQPQNIVADGNDFSAEVNPTGSNTYSFSVTSR